MRQAALIGRIPRLFHVAEPDAWATIEVVGLL